MRVIAFDTETSLIRPGCTAPALTCLTYEEQGTDGAHICLQDEAKDVVRGWLLDSDVRIVGHNVAFDMAVLCAEHPELLPLTFKAYAEDRITDTMIRAKLSDIARGIYRGRMGDEGKWIKIGYSLAECARRYAGLPIKKEGFRLFYGPLRGVPIEEWAEAARALQVRGAIWLAGGEDAELEHLAACFGDREKFRKETAGMIAVHPSEVVTYPVDDARATLAVWAAQEAWGEASPDEFRQARKAWALHLTSAWGLRTNGHAVNELQRETEAQCEALREALQREGLIRADGSRDTVKAKERMLSVCGWVRDEESKTFVEARVSRDGEDEVIPLRLTDSGELSLDADACKATGDEVLRNYARLTSLKAVLNKDIPMLVKGTVHPVHTRFDMAETARVTSSSPNIQNIKRM